MLTNVGLQGVPLRSSHEKMSIIFGYAHKHWSSGSTSEIITDYGCGPFKLPKGFFFAGHFDLH